MRHIGRWSSLLSLAVFFTFPSPVLAGRIIEGPDCNTDSFETCNGADWSLDTRTVCTWIEEGAVPGAGQTDDWSVISPDDPRCGPQYGPGGDGSSGDCTATHTCTF